MKKLLFLSVLSLLACKSAEPLHKNNTGHVAPAITQLPFGPGMKKKEDLAQADAALFKALIGTGLDSDNPIFTPTYLLPTTTQINYYAIEREVREVICDGQNSKNMFTVPRYKLRLPDYKGFQIYYMTNDAVKPEAESNELREPCDYVYNYYGNLVVYNPTTKTANIITLFNSTYNDWPYDRMFFIEKDYTIYIADFTADDGGEELPPYPGPSFKITISDTGEFLIDRLLE